MRSGPTSSNYFLVLAITQTAHSIEEYYFRLYDVFEPTRNLIGLFSDNLALGFAVGNTLVVIFFFWTYFRRVRPGAASAAAWMWGWSVVEFLNGVLHVSLAINADAYFPGLFTAPILILISVALMYRLVHPVGQTSVQ